MTSGRPFDDAPCGQICRCGPLNPVYCPLFPDVIYQYQSHGVVLEGEPKEIFNNPGRFMPRRGELPRCLYV